MERFGVLEKWDIRLGEHQSPADSKQEDKVGIVREEKEDKE